MKWTIGKMLIVSFMTLTIIVLILGIIGYVGINNGENSIDEIANVLLPSMESILVLQQGQTEIDTNENALMCPLLTIDEREVKYKNFETSWQRIDKAWKKYELLPQATEESVIWNRFVSAWASWKKGHEKYVKICKDYDKLHIVDPVALQVKVVKFNGDHSYFLEKLAEAILNKKNFTGQSNPAKCGFGKWLTTKQAKQLKNQVIISSLRKISDYHDQLHHAGAEIRDILNQNKDEYSIEKATKIYNEKAEPAGAEVHKFFIQIEEEIHKALVLYNLQVKQALDNIVFFDACAMGLNKLVEINSNDSSKTAKQAQNSAILLKTISTIALIVGVILSLGLALIISRYIGGILNRISSQMDEGADQVVTASGQVSSSSQQLAEGSSEQAASIEETSASLEEMSAMTKQNAENASQADNLMKQANQVVTSANGSMSKLTQSMEEISKASEETFKIIKTIDEIAFQTNLLALNAAVEAARAGEAGAGFAVVADEVRNLAMRAAEAAKNTSTLIEGTVEKINEGSRVVESTSSAFGEVEVSTNKVGELVAEISAASTEQAEGIEQINKAITEMDKVTQSNAAGAEESASASEELNAQAEQMKFAISELTVLVRGDANNNIKYQSTQSMRYANQAPQRNTMSIPQHKQTSSLAKQQRGVVSSKKEISPNEVIPFNDDDFSDF